jgi:hypothetical protein
MQMHVGLDCEREWRECPIRETSFSAWIHARTISGWPAIRSTHCRARNGQRSHPVPRVDLEYPGRSVLCSNHREWWKQPKLVPDR